MARKKADTSKYLGSAIMRHDLAEREQIDIDAWAKQRKVEARELGYASKKYKRKVSFDGHSVEQTIVALYEFSSEEQITFQDQIAKIGSDGVRC